MYLSFIVYAACLALFIWGISFAGRGRFHEDYLSADVMKSMRGFAAIGVILHHISQEELFQQASELSIFVNAGYMFVSLFFFCSGYGLLKSLDTKPGYMDTFLRRRLPVIIVPYYVSIVFYGIFNIITGNRLAPLQWATNIIGVTMMNEYAWYPIVLAVLYIAFYLIFKKEGTRGRKFVYMLIVILALGMIFCVGGHFPWWAGSSPNWWMNPYSADSRKWYLQQKVFWFSGEWWVNSQVAFLLGMIYESYEKNISGFFQNRYPLKMALLIAATIITDIITSFAQGVFGYWAEFAGDGPAIGAKIICYFTQITHVVFFTLYIVVFLMKLRTMNPVSRFFGKYSLDTYMMNLMAILIFRPLFLDFPGRIIKDPQIGRPLFFVCVFVVTVILGLVYHKINAFIEDKIRK